jgi:hypothetical protein
MRWGRWKHSGTRCKNCICDERWLLDSLFQMWEQRNTQGRQAFLDIIIPEFVVRSCFGKALYFWNITAQMEGEVWHAMQYGTG